MDKQNESYPKCPVRWQEILAVSTSWVGAIVYCFRAKTSKKRKAGVLAATLILNVIILGTSKSPSTSSGTNQASDQSGTTTSADNPGNNSIEIGKIKVTNIALSKLKDSSARSGYVFVFKGDVTNAGDEEVSRTGSVGASVGACLTGNIKDNAGRKFDVSCDIPALLPGETAKNVAFAHSTAMSNSETAELCVSWVQCTEQLTPKD